MPQARIASRRSSGRARLSIGPDRVDDEMSCCLLPPLPGAAIAAGMDRLAFWRPVRPLCLLSFTSVKSNPRMRAMQVGFFPASGDASRRGLRIELEPTKASRFVGE